MIKHLITSKTHTMVKIKCCIAILLFFNLHFVLAQNTTKVSHFDKVIVSPHIEVTFVEGDEETVIIEKSMVNNDKINIEVNGKTLRIYLDGAKEVTKNETVNETGNNERRPIYKGTVLTATVIYKTLDELSVRGEETMVCKSMLKGDKFHLSIYGESQVFINEVALNEFKATMYGESDLIIKAGTIKAQKYTNYGESKVNSLDVKSSTTKLTVYGESSFLLNVSDEIKITAFGEAVVEYKGNPVINKGLNIGEVKITKLD